MRELEMSKEIAELCKALVVAQGEFKNVIKDSDNPYYKSKYADLGSVVEMARPVLAKNGLAISQLIRPNSEVAEVETNLLHTSGQWISSTITLKPTKSDPQGMGSAITYARRYALSAILGIASEVDDDANSASTPMPVPGSKQYINKGMKANALAENDKKVEVLKEEFKI